MRHVLVLTALVVLALAVPGCAREVVIQGGDDGAAGAPGRPPAQPPFIKGEILAVSAVEPVTTDCVSEADGDGDGVVSSDDPPVCDPNPSDAGTIHVRRTDGQDGETEIVATIGVQTPVARRTAAGGVEPIGFDDLAQGDTVTLWVTGPVMESFPVQAGADYVLQEQS